MRWKFMPREIDVMGVLKEGAMNNFLQRILSSIAIALVIIGVVFLPMLFFYAMIALLLFGCAYEWQGMAVADKRLQWLFSVGCVAAYAVSVYYSLDCLVVIGAIWWLMAWGMLAYYVKRPPATPRWSTVMHILHGGMTLLPMAYALTVIRGFGIEYWIILFVWVWSTDLGGYLFGRPFGKHKLLPAVSPGKSYEGFLGGIFCVIVVTTALYFSYDVDDFGYLDYIAVAVMISVIAVIGDLYESMVKRRFAVKDSGYCIPGHGGMLDRFDSICAAAPIFAILLWFMPI